MANTSSKEAGMHRRRWSLGHQDHHHHHRSYHRRYYRSNLRNPRHHHHPRYDRRSYHRRHYRSYLRSRRKIHHNNRSRCRCSRRNSNRFQPQGATDAARPAPRPRSPPPLRGRPPSRRRPRLSPSGGGMLRGRPIEPARVRGRSRYAAPGRATSCTTNFVWCVWCVRKGLTGGMLSAPSSGASWTPFLNPNRWWKALLITTYPSLSRDYKRQCRL